MQVELLSDVSRVDAADWDALTGADDPFVEHAFLLALEQSRSVGPGTGWRPLHVLVRQGARLVGALPLYVKDHSWGEYVFDFAWASASERAGVRYYPKLVAMAPFTPATGRRLLLAADVDAPSTVGALLEGAEEAARRVKASGLHVLFVTERERDLLLAAGGDADTALLSRESLQFHWLNDGYASWDDYVARFRSALRKQVRRERAQALSGGVEVRVIEGEGLSKTEMHALQGFYMDTCHKRGSGPYLTPAFFELIARTHARRIVAVLAYRAGREIGGTLSFQKGAHLYGRYWGATEELPALHFECCYYRLIERAIEQRLARFEAGAQGAHKLRRGLLPAAIHSVHGLAHPGLHAAVADFLERERQALARERAELAEHGPFHREHRDGV
jgi:predicted N-acyltransferase